VPTESDALRARFVHVEVRQEHLETDKARNVGNTSWNEKENDAVFGTDTSR
jgi:hypothetical protein